MNIGSKTVYSPSSQDPQTTIDTYSKSRTLLDGGKRRVNEIFDDGNISLIVVTRRRAWPFVSITTYIGPNTTTRLDNSSLSAPVIGFKAEKVTRNELRAEGGGKIQRQK
jgi:hypothetical protein